MNQRAHIIRSTHSQRSGTTSMEFAFVAPVLFLIIFGCFEITRMSLLLNLAQDACYDAARFCMVEGATEQEAIDRAQSVLSMMTATNAQVMINEGDGLHSSDKSINVSIVIPMEDNAFFLKQFYTGRYINASITLRVERYSGYYSDD